MLSNHKLIGAIVMLGTAFLLWDLRRSPISGWQIAGAALAIPAVGLWFVARLQLGQSFSVTAQARHLVTTGVYSKIRNPIYVFGLLFITGIILYSERFWWLLAIPVLLVLQFWRAVAEAAVLEAKFGDEYRKYRERTWF